MQSAVRSRRGDHRGAVRRRGGPRRGHRVVDHRCGVALPLALVGGVALAAAIEDARTGRIPNGLILTGITIVACSWGFVAVARQPVDGSAGRRRPRWARARRRPRGLPRLARRAPTDRWRRLEAARRARRGDRVTSPRPRPALVPMAAFGAAAVAASARHRRHVHLGPFLAAGYAVAIVATVVEPELFGSWYIGHDGRLMKTLQDAKETRLSNSTIAADRITSRWRQRVPAPPPQAHRPPRWHRSQGCECGRIGRCAPSPERWSSSPRWSPPWPSTHGSATARRCWRVSRDVLAGEQIDDADLEVVSMSSDDGIPTIPASQRGAIVGQYARVRLLAGSLLAADSVQPRPIVDPERVLMSVVVPVGLVPVGLREQSRVVLVVTPPTSGGVRPAPVLVEAVVAVRPARPRRGRRIGRCRPGGRRPRRRGAAAVRRRGRRGRGGERRRARWCGAVPRRPGRTRQQIEPVASTTWRPPNPLTLPPAPPPAANLDGPTTIPTVVPTTTGPQG